MTAQIQNISKETEILKEKPIEIPELKSTVSETKIHNRFEPTEK